jgi:hypothetical protein
MPGAIGCCCKYGYGCDCSVVFHGRAIGSVGVDVGNGGCEGEAEGGALWGRVAPSTGYPV